MRRITTAVALVALAALPAPALAQQAQGQMQEEVPPTLRLSFFQCHQNRIGDVLEEVEQFDIPIWRELVDEGMVMNYGYFVHSWADEYNLGIYTIGRDIPAILAASDEAGSRAEERFPDAPDTFGEVCPWHRDGFYTLGPSAGMDEPAGEPASGGAGGGN